MRSLLDDKTRELTQLQKQLKQQIARLVSLLLETKKRLYRDPHAQYADQFSIKIVCDAIKIESLLFKQPF